MKPHVLALCACISAWITPAIASPRTDFLNAIRPEVSRLAGQPIRFRIVHLNMASGWAALYGNLEAEAGKSIDWTKAPHCNSELDKSLWLTAKKIKGSWQIQKIDICSPEPFYWYLSADDFLVPCEIYAGMMISEAHSAQQECTAHQAKVK